MQARWWILFAIAVLVACDLEQAFPRVAADDKSLVYVISAHNNPTGRRMGEDARTYNRIFYEKDIAVFDAAASKCDADKVEAKLFVVQERSVLQDLSEWYPVLKDGKNVNWAPNLQADDIKKDLWTNSVGKSVIVYLHGHGTRDASIPEQHYVALEDPKNANQRITKNFFLTPPAGYTGPTPVPWKRLTLLMCACYGGSFFHPAVDYDMEVNPQTYQNNDLLENRVEKMKKHLSKVVTEDRDVYTRHKIIAMLASSRREYTDEVVCEESLPEAFFSLLRVGRDEEVYPITSNFAQSCSKSLHDNYRRHEKESSFDQKREVQRSLKLKAIGTIPDKEPPSDKEADARIRALLHCIVVPRKYKVNAGQADDKLFALATRVGDFMRDVFPPQCPNAPSKYTRKSGYTFPHETTSNTK